MDPNEVPLVSLVVPMRNEERYIGRCLQSVAEGDYPCHRVEVLVVDGRSSDNSRAVVADFARQAPFSVRLLDNPEGTTYPALNIGIKSSQGDIIGIASSHSRLGPGFISRGVALIRERDVDCVSGPITSVGIGLFGQAISLAMSTPFGVGNALFRYSQREELVDQAAFALYRREVFEEVGDFDPAMDGDADSDFHYRLVKMGGRILQSPRLESYYYVRTSLPALFRQYFTYGFSKLVTMRRHRNRTKVRQVIPSLFVLSLLVSAAGAFVFQPARTVFATIGGSYALANLTASTYVAARAGWRYLPLLPLVFSCLHLSYGLGLLWATCRWAILGEDNLRARIRQG